MNDRQIVILTIGGLLLALNALLPPMTYDNWTIDGRPKRTRRFFAVSRVFRAVEVSDAKAGMRTSRAASRLSIDLPVLVAEEFIIIGITVAMIGIVWPQNRGGERREQDSPEVEQ